MAGHTVGYIRISTLDQDAIQQLDGEILDLAFTNTVSGKHQNRPELEDLIKFVRDGDTVLGHSMDRLARDLGISRETVYQYLRASQQPGKSIARRGTQWEELMLIAEHPAEYVTYGPRVGSFLPGIGRLRHPRA